MANRWVKSIKLWHVGGDWSSKLITVAHFIAPVDRNDHCNRSMSVNLSTVCQWCEWGWISDDARGWGRLSGTCSRPPDWPLTTLTSSLSTAVRQCVSVEWVRLDLRRCMWLRAAVRNGRTQFNSISVKWLSWQHTTVQYSCHSIRIGHYMNSPSYFTFFTAATAAATTVVGFNLPAKLIQKLFTLKSDKQSVTDFLTIL